MADADSLDAVILGAGPAGCSAGLWLSELGYRVALVEEQDHLLSRLVDLQLAQNWVLGEPEASTADLARRYAAHVMAQPSVRCVLGDSLAQVDRLESQGRWRLLTQAQRRLQSRVVLVCTGLRRRVFAACTGPVAPLDAQALTRQRAHLRPGRFLLLGGGDNAVENADYLTNAGHQVTLWSRSALRANRHLIARLSARAGALTLRVGQAMPGALVSTGADGPWQVRSAAHGDEAFDHVAVLFGNVPNDAPLHLLAQAAACDPNALPARGVFLAGDLSGRWHPCISTALADGVQAAKAAQRWLEKT